MFNSRLLEAAKVFSAYQDTTTTTTTPTHGGGAVVLVLSNSRADAQVSDLLTRKTPTQGGAVVLNSSLICLPGHHHDTPAGAPWC